MIPEDKSRQIQNRDNWEETRPQRLPATTYWPFFFAMGLTFLAWGLLTSWMIGGAGVLLLVISLTGWITELRHEARKRKD